jgi:hypothetical protein
MNWSLKQNNTTTDYSTFPYAFRAMMTIVRKAAEEKKPINTSELTIIGPVGPRGERNKYNFTQAKQMARDMGLLDDNGNINGKEFKRKF